jgi:hypothetical protein
MDLDVRLIRAAVKNLGLASADSPGTEETHGALGWTEWHVVILVYYPHHSAGLAPK